MAVPDTNTFTLQDVVDEINPTTDDLQTCFDEAISGGFDPAYEGSKNALLNFRNYVHETKTYIYNRGSNPENLILSQNAGNNLYSFETGYLRIYRTNSGGGTATIRFESDSLLVNVGDTIHFVYNNLLTTSGYVDHIQAEVLGATNPNARIDTPSDIGLQEITVSSDSFINGTTNKIELEIVSESALFDLRILELYLIQ